MASNIELTGAARLFRAATSSDREKHDTAGATESIWRHANNIQRFFTSSAVGWTTGMIELMKAFVIPDDRPVIFIGVGIRKSDR